MERRKQTLDMRGIKTYSARERKNLVTIEGLMTPGVTPHATFADPNLDLLTERILAARSNGRPVIWSMGAHVIKNHLSRYVIELMKQGMITHIAANGATSIHDFELCYLGGTSEDVPTAIEDGSFGMWEETGGWMNEAIRLGAAQNMRSAGKVTKCDCENENYDIPYKSGRCLITTVPFTSHLKNNIYTDREIYETRQQGYCQYKNSLHHI